MKRTIDEEEYLEMLNRIEKLEALEIGGVENWEWYDKALEGYNQQLKVKEGLDRLLVDLTVDCEVEQPIGAGGGYSVTLSTDARESILEFINEHFELKKHEH